MNIFPSLYIKYTWIKVFCIPHTPKLKQVCLTLNLFSILVKFNLCIITVGYTLQLCLKRTISQLTVKSSNSLDTNFGGFHWKLQTTNWNFQRSFSILRSCMETFACEENQTEVKTGDFFSIYENWYLRKYMNHQWKTLPF